MKATALLGAQHLDEAEATLREGLSRHPRSAGLHLRRGLLRLFHYKDLEGAERDFRVALTDREQSPIGRTGMGIVAFERGQYGEAVKWLRPVARMSPENPDPIAFSALAWALVADAEEGSGSADLTEAEDLCERAVTLIPDERARDRALPHGCLGIIYVIREEHGRAERHLRRAMELDPSEPSSAVNLGALLRTTGRYRDAKEVLEAALARDDGQARAHLELGMLLLALGDPSLAARHTRQARDLDPGMAEAHEAHALALIEQHRLDDAERVLREGLASTRQRARWRVRLALARVLTAVGDASSSRSAYEDAVEEVGHALHQRSDDPDAVLQRGVLELKLGDPTRALRSFKWVLERDPGNPSAERFVTATRAELRRERAGARPVLVYGLVLAVIAIGSVGALWYAYFERELNAGVLIGGLPVLMGLVVVAAMLPKLTGFKLGNLEAQLESVAVAAPRQVAGPTIRVEVPRSAARLREGRTTFEP